MTCSRTQFGYAALLASCFLPACGNGGGPAGFGPQDGGSDATLDGTKAKDTGPISLLGDTGGGEGSGPCTGLACQVKACGGDSNATTVSGTVYAPNGTLPLYDVQVFVPNSPLADFPKGVQCDQCGAPLSGNPITTALSDPSGHFELKGVPAGTNIPIVVQLGKWRRQAIIPTVNACTNTALTDANLTRLPKTQAEGSMPHIALTTGGCDKMGCMLPKIGIDPSEFGYQSDGYAKAVNTYQASPEGWPQATAADQLWSSPTLLATYDVGIFSCECDEALGTKGGSPTAPEFGYMTDYLNKGGRIFTTDFQYTWYKYSPDSNLGGSPVGSATTGIGTVVGGAPVAGFPPDPMNLVTSFPKGMALSQWLQVVFPSNPAGEVIPDVIFANVTSLNASKALTWATSPDEEGSFEDPSPSTDAGGPRVFTVNTPAGKPTAQQCGRGVHLDAHIDSDQIVGPGFPTTGCTDPLAPDEAMFAFFFFDLSSCIQNDMLPPMPPPK
jgi:hypothetical protein